MKLLLVRNTAPSLTQWTKNYKLYGVDCFLLLHKKRDHTLSEQLLQIKQLVPRDSSLPIIISSTFLINSFFNNLNQFLAGRMFANEITRCNHTWRVSSVQKFRLVCKWHKCSYINGSDVLHLTPLTRLAKFHFNKFILVWNLSNESYIRFVKHKLTLRYTDKHTTLMQLCIKIW